MTGSLCEAAQKIEERLVQIDKLMEAEPLGMVSKPHICWATDQLSILSRQVRELLAEIIGV